MGLGEWFSDFCSALQVQDGGTISYRYRQLTRRLNTDFRDTTSDTANSFYSGSYGRNTAIKGFSDLDMVFVLPFSVYSQYNAYSGNKQSQLLQAVKTSIERTYPSSAVRADGQIVQIAFDDGITFEVLPAFLNDSATYTFPDANDGGSWRATNPKAEISAMQLRNDACKGNLVRLCRMARAWRNTWSVPIGGFLIDTLAYQFIENYEHREKAFLYYDYLSRDFFAWMKSQSAEQEFWRAPGSGQYVYGKGLFQYKATRCYNISLEAIKNETSAPTTAKKEWREIFGSAFPN